MESKSWTGNTTLGVLAERTFDAPYRRAYKGRMLKSAPTSLAAPSTANRDASDLRLRDVIHRASSLDSLAAVDAALSEWNETSASDSAREGIVIVGYPDDEGIELGGGRPGAKEGPDRIRTALYKMTPPAFFQNAGARVFDAGNLGASLRSGTSIEKRHEQANAVAQHVLACDQKLLTFGGGHDYGYPDAAAYVAWAKKRGERPLVINFDAHMDVRPLNNGFTSGTPFFRLLSDDRDIDFVELGLQSQCNARGHVEWAKERGAKVMFEEERRAEGLSLTQVLHRFLGEWAGNGAIKHRSAMLSIDIDGFSSAIAPGASQSWPTGFQADDFFSAFSWCLARLNVRALGIYEVSPRFDVDDRTSRLAALIAHRYVFQL